MGVSLAHLPLSGAYLVNTGQNHSEMHGPYATWRRALSAAVRRFGEPVDQSIAASLGLEMKHLLAESRRRAARQAPRPAAPPDETHPE